MNRAKAFTLIELLVVIATIAATTRVHAQTTQWVRIWTDPASTPVGREAHAMIYDDRREVVVMHGGYNALQPDAGMSDTWEWDGTQWKNMDITGPGDRSFHATAYESHREGVAKRRRAH